MRAGVLVFAVVVALAVPARGQDLAQWRAHIGEASVRFDIPVAWIEQVIRVESGGRTMRAGRPIRSRVGAIGLMQLMPGTWDETRALLGLGDDPDDPRNNILAGTFYLRRMYDRFGYPGLFAAYNAGPARYADYLSGGRSLPPETRDYLATVTDRPPRRRVGPRRTIESDSLFVARSTASTIGGDGQQVARPDGLFAVLSPGRGDEEGQ